MLIVGLASSTQSRTGWSLHPRSRSAFHPRSRILSAPISTAPRQPRGAVAPNPLGGGHCDDLAAINAHQPQ